MTERLLLFGVRLQYPPCMKLQQAYKCNSNSFYSSRTPFLTWRYKIVLRGRLLTLERVLLIYFIPHFSLFSISFLRFFTYAKGTLTCILYLSKLSLFSLFWGKVYLNLRAWQILGHFSLEIILPAEVNCIYYLAGIRYTRERDKSR